MCVFSLSLYFTLLIQAQGGSKSNCPLYISLYNGSEWLSSQSILWIHSSVGSAPWGQDKDAESPGLSQSAASATDLPRVQKQGGRSALRSRQEQWVMQSHLCIFFSWVHCCDSINGYIGLVSPSVCPSVCLLCLIVINRVVKSVRVKYLYANRRFRVMKMFLELKSSSYSKSTSSQLQLITFDSHVLCN